MTYGYKWLDDTNRNDNTTRKIRQGKGGDCCGSTIIVFKQKRSDGKGIGSIPFAPNPALTFYQSYGIALLCGPIFLLMLAKVPKHGTIAILGIINGIVWFVLGMHWAMDLGYIVMGIAADIVAGIKGFKNMKLNILAYALFCWGPAGVLLAVCNESGYISVG